MNCRANIQITSGRVSPGAIVRSVCLFLKSPRLGEAKTRLARDIGAARASAIYRALVEHQAAEIPIGWRVTVYFAPSNAGEEMKIWLAPPDRSARRIR